MAGLVDTAALTVYAWALLPNHFHLLVRTGRRPLARSMRSLLTGYAGAFNRRYRRTGHLFQNRYKSVVCDEEAYFLELVRYLHEGRQRREPWGYTRQRSTKWHAVGGKTRPIGRAYLGRSKTNFPATSPTDAASVKAGVAAAIGSVLLHLGILHLPFELGMGQPEFRSLVATLVGGAIFPFMGCISAAVTLGQ